MSSQSSPVVVLVTGANKGLGLETVKILAREKPDWTILIGSRSLANGEQAAQSIGSGNVRVIVIDVTDDASISRAVQQIQAEYGGLDYLVHNSGISPFTPGLVQHPTHSKPYSDAIQVFDVNVYGVHRIQQAFEPLLRKSGKTVLVGSGVVSMSYQHLSTELQSIIDNVDSCDWATVNKLAQRYLESVKSDDSENGFWPDTPERKGGSFGSYGMSKVLVTAYFRHYALKHPERNVVIADPGYCATDLNNRGGPRPPMDGGLSIAWVVTHATKSGGFYFDGAEKSFTVAQNTFGPSVLRPQQ